MFLWTWEDQTRCLLETVSSIQDREAAPMKSPQFAHLIKMWTILMPAWVEEISQYPIPRWRPIGNNDCWEMKDQSSPEMSSLANSKWSVLNTCTYKQHQMDLVGFKCACMCNNNCRGILIQQHSLLWQGITSKDTIQLECRHDTLL